MVSAAAPLSRESAFTDSEVPKGPLAPTFPRTPLSCMSPHIHMRVRLRTTLTNSLAALAAFNAACTWKMLATLEEYGHQIPLTNRHVLLVVPSSFVRPFCVPLCRPPSLPSPSASVPRAHLERLGMNGCRRLSTLGRSYYTYRRLLSLLRTERSLFLSSPLQQQQQQHHHHDCRCS